mmetsp:Transcript_42042/g.116136  ORF Transcript_42042/g.116136 Transcript_42042/m.116136 type:complete len:228 (+) Transcript_42042:829-1512(+)|eukprot:543458-Prymnesium_polylepis.1
MPLDVCAKCQQLLHWPSVSWIARVQWEGTLWQLEQPQQQRCSKRVMRRIGGMKVSRHKEKGVTCQKLNRTMLREEIKEMPADRQRCLQSLGFDFRRSPTLRRDSNPKPPELLRTLGIHFTAQMHPHRIAWHRDVAPLVFSNPLPTPDGLVACLVKTEQQVCAPSEFRPCIHLYNEMCRPRNCQPVASLQLVADERMRRIQRRTTAQFTFDVAEGIVTQQAWEPLECG